MAQSNRDLSTSSSNSSREAYDFKVQQTNDPLNSEGRLEKQDGSSEEEERVSAAKCPSACDYVQSLTPVSR